ncbi:MAG: HAD family hydrolase [Rhodospirillales bacterium]|jgi:D-glycero-D-manno-heptose 1,7-bisphosphate phosphatase|nr:HAD family hydrolase [Rhodospirillales bacterium]
MTTVTNLPTGAPIDKDGVWSQVLKPPAGSRRRAALFLDRDGVIVEEVGYLHLPSETRLIDGAASVIANANRRGVPVVLITNQGGIGLGHYDWHAFVKVQDEIFESLAGAGATLDAVYACPHHPRGKAPFDCANHPARKPNPGMLVRAEEALRLDLAASWIVGDRAIDMEAGRRAGLRGGTHVLTGHGTKDGEREAALACAGSSFRVLDAASIADAATVPLF